MSQSASGSAQSMGQSSGGPVSQYVGLSQPMGQSVSGSDSQLVGQSSEAFEPRLAHSCWSLSRFL